MTANTTVIILLLLYMISGLLATVNRFNIVIFFTKSNADNNSADICQNGNSEDGIKCLEFLKVAVVPGSRNGHCTRQLSNGLLCLIHYAESTLRMFTGVAALANDTFGYNSAWRRSADELTKKRPGKRRKRFKMYTFPVDDHDFFANFNEINQGFIRQKHQEDFISLVKRSSQPTPRPRRKKSFLETLGILDSFKNTFFGKLFEDDDSKKLPIGQHQPFGNVCPSFSIFVLVKQMLGEIQSLHCNNGFLLLIFGGESEELGNVESPLVQSIKLVEENTNPESTLIIVTKSCPNKSEERKCNIPIFAKGPQAAELRNTPALTELPFLIKAILSSMYPFKYNSKNGSQSEGVYHRRRSVREAPILTPMLSGKTHTFDASMKMLPCLITCSLIYAII